MTLIKIVNSATLSITITLLLANTHLLADTIYKSTDKYGDITYSSSPTNSQSDTIKIDILPPPSEEGIKAAKDRHQKNLETDKILDESRKKRSQENAEKNRIRREKKSQTEAFQEPEETKEEGPYYGIPGHGILVLPKGPGLQNR